MKFTERLMRFIEKNSTEISKPMDLGYAIYFYYLFCLLGMFFCGIFFPTLDDSLIRPIADVLVMLVMIILFFYNKKKYNLREKWKKRKMCCKNLVCICFLSKTATYLGACIIYALVRILGVDYSSLYGTPTSVGYNLGAILSAVVLTPIIEEFIFRGIALLPFEKKDNKLEFLIFTSIIFGLMHCNWYQAIVATLDGFLYGYVAVEFGLFYAILLHAIHNGWVYLAYFLKPFINVNYISFAIFVITVCNTKNIIKQFKLALRSERTYSFEKQGAYLMNPIILVCSIVWILTILNIV